MAKEISKMIAKRNKKINKNEKITLNFIKSIREYKHAPVGCLD